jgi:hypothetical protein
MAQGVAAQPIQGPEIKPQYLQNKTRSNKTVFLWIELFNSTLSWS